MAGMTKVISMKAGVETLIIALFVLLGVKLVRQCHISIISMRFRLTMSDKLSLGLFDNLRSFIF